MTRAATAIWFGDSGTEELTGWDEARGQAEMIAEEWQWILGESDAEVSSDRLSREEVNGWGERGREVLCKRVLRNRVGRKPVIGCGHRGGESAQNKWWRSLFWRPRVMQNSPYHKMCLGPRCLPARQDSLFWTSDLTKGTDSSQVFRPHETALFLSNTYRKQSLRLNRKLSLKVIFDG